MYKTGLVGVASRLESGAERGESILAVAKAQLEKAGIEVALCDKLVYDPHEALEACAYFKKEQIVNYIVIDITWVCDSLKYILVHEMDLPVTFWAVPYTKTFSIGCVQHFVSILKNQGIPFQYVYGSPEDEKLIAKLTKMTAAAAAIQSVREMKVCLMGPRETWRVAGAQDMTNEEWEFSKFFGATIIHLEMEEVIHRAVKIADEAAQKVYDETLAARTGTLLISQKALLYLVKIYMAAKEVIAQNKLCAIAAECYIRYSGLMNLPASWLADEGFILDTEGDIGHAVVMYMLNQVAGGGFVILGECGSFDDENNIFAIAHEGSTATAATGDLSRVQVNPNGELGAFVGTPVKAMPLVTVCGMVSSAGKYKMMISTAETLPVSHQDWMEGGKKLLEHLRFKTNAAQMMDDMINAGLDHHFLVKEGDYTEEMAMICDYFGIEKILL